MANTLTPATAVPSDASLITWTNIIYALHAASVVIAVVGSATIIGSFLFGIPSIVAVIMNYLKRSDVRGTYLESHFTWQIRTFWYAALWAVITSILFVITIIGIFLLWIPMGLLGIWIAYRVARGWLALRGGQPIAV
jgi:uncharacterized membrane protein